MRCGCTSRLGSICAEVAGGGQLPSWRFTVSRKQQTSFGHALFRIVFGSSIVSRTNWWTLLVKVFFVYAEVHFSLTPGTVVSLATSCVLCCDMAFTLTHWRWCSLVHTKNHETIWPSEPLAHNPVLR